MSPPVNLALENTHNDQNSIHILPMRRKFHQFDAKNKSTTRPCMNQSVNISLTNLNDKLKLLHSSSSTLSLNEQYLIDEIRKSTLLNQANNCSIKTLNNLSFDSSSTKPKRQNSIGSNDSSSNLEQSLSHQNQQNGSLSFSVSSPSHSVSTSSSNSSNSNNMIEETEKQSNVVFRHTNILLNDLIDDLDEEVENVEYSSANEENNDRRETLIFKQNERKILDPSEDLIIPEADLTINSDLSKNTTESSFNCSSTTNLTVNSHRSKKTSTLSSSHSFNLACEVASLTSVYSNYSQFDFLNVQNNSNHGSNRASPSPPPINHSQPSLVNNASGLPVSDSVSSLNGAAQTGTSVSKMKKAANASSSNNSLSSFLGLFGNKKQQQTETKTPQNTTTTTTTTTATTSLSSNDHHNNNKNSTLDLIASKFFSLKSSSKVSVDHHSPTSTNSQNGSKLEKQPSVYSTSSSSSTSLNNDQQQHNNSNNNAEGRSAADAVRRKRKVRATQSILLPNRKPSAKVE